MTEPKHDLNIDPIDIDPQDDPENELENNLENGGGR